jgi:hypothetical protein
LNKHQRIRDMKQELCILESLKDAHKRGRRFEFFLAQLLEADSFEVVRNSKSATPRQTDLSARRDPMYFLVEAKWLKRAVSIGHISDARERLRLVPPDVFGCIFSMSGYTAGAVAEACRVRNLEIVLFDGDEVRGLAAGDLVFSELLQEKRAALRMHASAYFHPWSPNESFLRKVRSRSNVFQVSKVTKTAMLCNTGDNDVVFSIEGLDFIGRYNRSSVSLGLNLQLDSISDLERLFWKLRKHIELSYESSFAIHQRNAGWFGFGLDNFMAAVRNQQARYAELNWDTYHHSEELAYVDRIDGGGLFCLTSRQSTSEGAGLHSSRIEIFLPGIPVDLGWVQSMCKLTGNPDANFENIGKNPVKRLRLPRSISLAPVAPIVSKVDGREYVSGLVVKNPFLGEPIPPGKDASLGDPFWLLCKNEYLFCALASWHNTGVLMNEYRLRQVEGCWIEHVPVFYILCDWS